MISILNQLETQFGLKKLYKKGLIPWTVLRDRDIYLKYDTYIKMGRSEMEAKEFTADDFGISLSAVYRAVRKMTDEKDSSSPQA
jgi:hypothetical protein